MRKGPDKIGREIFLDSYFASRLQELVKLIENPQASDRNDHLSDVYDTLMRISDEYQSVMLDEEEGYWLSLELWDDECNQQKAVELAHQLVNDNTPL